jgi:hypothetical protein
VLVLVLDTNIGPIAGTPVSWSAPATMIFAAVADIHGNALALEAVLADIARLGV